MDDVLREKYRSQREIAKSNDYSIEKMVTQAEKETKRLAGVYGIRLKTARLPTVRVGRIRRGRVLKRRG